MTDDVARWAAELQSLAQAGLFYGHDDFDKERYQRIREISVEMLATRTDLPAERLTDLFCGDVGYQTPKVDTRAAIFDDGRILLVRERDGRWSLPGGWCDYNLSPAANVVKEVREEAGLDATVRSLIAVHDRDLHNAPPYIYHVVKIFYLCEAAGGHFEQNIETTASGFFAQDNLPELAVAKCSLDQVQMCFSAHDDPHWVARFD